MQYQETKGTSVQGWKTLLAMLLAAGALAACNDSGSNGNGDDDSNGSGGETSNGSGDSSAGGSGSNAVLVYEEIDNSNLERRLYAVSADDPTDVTAVTPTAQDNDLATGSLSSGSAPDTDKLPLGVLGGDFSNGELTNAGYHYTVFNTEDGELYRLDARNGDTTAERFSSEDDAAGICAAFVVPDLAAIDNSRLVYQVAADADCDDTDIRMVRIGDDESGTVITLQSDITDGEQLDTVTAVRNADGELTEILFHINRTEDNELMVHNLASGDQSTLKDDLTDFSVLGYADGGETLIFMRDLSNTTNVGTFRAYSETDGVVTFSGWDLNIGIDDSRSVQVGDNLYVVDHSESAVIEINGTKATRIDDDWSTGPSVKGVTAANGYLAFAYETNSKWNIRQVNLDTGNATDIVTELDNADFGMNSDKAPGDNGSYWYLYTDLSGDDPVAHGIEFTSGGGTFKIEDARWRGGTWSRTLGETGLQAEYLIYQASGQGGALYSVDATDPNPPSTARDLGVEPLNWGHWVGGFGPETLIIGQEGQSTLDYSREVLHVDASAANSAARLTDDEDVDHRPVPFY